MPGQQAERLLHLSITGSNRDGRTRIRVPSCRRCDLTVTLPSQLSKGAKGVACLSGGVRMYTYFNPLIHAVLVCILSEADPRVKDLSIRRLSGHQRSMGKRRGGKAFHKECVTKRARSCGIWSSVPPGNLGARAEQFRGPQTVSGH